MVQPKTHINILLYQVTSANTVPIGTKAFFVYLDTPKPLKYVYGRQNCPHSFWVAIFGYEKRCSIFKHTFFFIPAINKIKYMLIQAILDMYH